jgi:hypothetical protein
VFTVVSDEPVKVLVIYSPPTKNRPRGESHEGLRFGSGRSRLSLAAPAYAQNYPNRPITLVVSFAAGSGTDGVARIVGQKLSERLKQPVVVDNKAGANGQIAAEFVKNAKPDGYTLWMTTNTTHSANPILYKELRYDPIKDFTPIILTGELPFALVVNNDLPPKTLKEFMAYARANPGKISTPRPTARPSSAPKRCASPASSTSSASRTNRARRRSPTPWADGADVHRRFRLGLANMKANKVRTLAVTPARKSKILPDVPPIGSEIPGFDLTSWNGIFGPPDCRAKWWTGSTRKCWPCSPRRMFRTSSRPRASSESVEDARGVPEVRRRPARALVAHDQGRRDQAGVAPANGFRARQ